MDLVRRQHLPRVRPVSVFQDPSGQVGDNFLDQPGAKKWGQVSLQTCHHHLPYSAISPQRRCPLVRPRARHRSVGGAHLRDGASLLLQVETLQQRRVFLPKARSY